MEITQDVKKGRLHSAYAIGAFDNAKEALESNGYRVISLEQNAGLRVQEGADSSVSIRGNWTREGFIYVPNKGAFLTKDSPLMENAEWATDCHRNGKEFYLNDEQVEKSLADSVKITETEIPTSRFADEAITNFAFGKNAKAYGEFLKENGIDSMQVYLANFENKPFARQAWLRRIDGDVSDLIGCGNLSYGDDGVRGVRASANSKGASVARKIEAYTPKDIQRALKTLKLAGLESQILEALKK
ncbi:MAG: hypothetical protein QXS38_01565 [Candidatus Pacearchaeota archaeon]